MRKNLPLPAARKVAIIAFDGITPFHLSVPCLVFGTDAGDGAAARFELAVCAVEAGPLRTSAGFAIAPESGLAALDDADIVVMPAWHDDCRSAPPVLLDALRRAHARGARVVGLCLGAFPLAQAGLLDGRTAATHWAAADAFASLYPKVQVNQEVLYVDQGDVLTSAGVAAGLDCCLHLLRQLCGAEIANRVARRLLIAPHRDGGQAQFIERPLPVSHSEGRFAQVLDWVARHPQHAHSIDALAERAAMSRRNFTRHFRQSTGTSFKQWLLNQRMAHAQRMLESGDASIEVVAQEAGFGTALSLRQHFRTVLRTSPSAYRKLFRSDQPAAA
ncbi:helix-turn-helix domain-containing protein [Massilia atriviolacea]|uniref:Helix-turn-helix domain-containing protein n=1 Tax=Massilia atriviolacea TaxID=2495579 RepID=A0A430HSK6_9BURK|nr:helix-turn-helix domain-containing protein [Massilia atriviolacea]RSZ60528.1 helix-turn-helix domain-containing protein [Massilia atriviolacea]